MFVIYLGLVGFLAFTLGVGILGLWLRKNPSRFNAERSSRIMHSLFFAGLVAPGVVMLVYPGLTQLDGLIGFNSLPSNSIILIVGILFAFIGLYLLGNSNKLLRASQIGFQRQHFPGSGRIIRWGSYLFAGRDRILGVKQVF